MTFNPNNYINNEDFKCEESNDTYSVVHAIVKQIELKKIDITPNYEDWLKIGFAIGSELGEKGRDLFHRISRFNKGYEKDVCDKQYNECIESSKDGITIATLFHYANEAGLKVNTIPSFNNRSTNKIDEIEAYLLSKYKFRYNTIRTQTEVCYNGSKEFVPLTDYRENSILRDLMKNNYNCSQAKLSAILCSDFCPRFNPFIDYFKNLEPWDVTTDYINDLANTVGTTNQEFWYVVLKKWLVALVASTLEPHIVNHIAFVFSGAQGLGKTSWMLKLCPPRLSNYLYTGTINPSNKDTMIYLAQCIIILLDELENMNRSDLAALKEVITKPVINMRRAYGRNNENMDRVASFCGSVNDSQFLNDSTGSRRFPSFEVERIDHKHNVDLDKVYAQAFALYNNGFKFYFDKDEIDIIAENNQKHQVIRVEEEYLLKYFTPIDPNEAIHFFTATEIMKLIFQRELIKVDNPTSIVLGKFLQKHKFHKVKKQGVYKYAVIPSKDIQI